MPDQNFNRQLASMIDHTLLKPEATPEQIKQLCSEAKQYGFASVCVNPSYVELCVSELQNTGIPVCSVIGFPLGSTSTEIKAAEAEYVIEKGAKEVDMVINIGRLKAGDSEYVLRDIDSVVKIARPKGVLTKVIIETCLLTDEEKILACKLAKKANADYVKTSTGFSKGGATPKDIALMRRAVGPNMGVKASGGIRTTEQVYELIEQGATRIGASSSIQIVTDNNSSTVSY